MFSKAKRFENVPNHASHTKNCPKIEINKPNITTKPIRKVPPTFTPSKNASDARSQCSSTSSFKPYTTPKLCKIYKENQLKKSASVKKNGKNLNHKSENISDDIIKEQEVEIRNKNFTIEEHNKQIEDLRNEIAQLQNQIQIECSQNCLNRHLSTLSLDDVNLKENFSIQDLKNIIKKLNATILNLEHQCLKLETEVNKKQVELTSLEEHITIRDSLCQDLQNKLTNIELSFEETQQRLEMIKGHHALALEANESIRQEYKTEIENLKIRHEEEKLSIINKCKVEQEHMKDKYKSSVESLTNQLINEKNDKIHELQQALITKELDMKAKLDQINEATQEKLRLCEIQFEEQSQTIQDHWSLQQEKIELLEKQNNEMKHTLYTLQNQKSKMEKDIELLKYENEVNIKEKSDLFDQLTALKEESKRVLVDYENDKNKLILEIEKNKNEKKKYELSLTVTRDIVEVLTTRLRESDNEVDRCEKKIKELSANREDLENELKSCKNKLNTVIIECNEYKEALVNILKSKAALSKEHTRIMEHNVTLMESLQNVEKEAYKELGTIKNEFIEDIELLKSESKSQILKLQEEVERKRLLCESATEQAGQATAAAEQARALCGVAADEIARLEADNEHLLLQIQEQQSLVVELSLLRHENEELTLTVNKQASLVDKMKREIEQLKSHHISPVKIKSPSVVRKSQKGGKENIQTIISPLRERNH